MTIEKIKNKIAEMFESRETVFESDWRRPRLFWIVVRGRKLLCIWAGNMKKTDVPLIEMRDAAGDGMFTAAEWTSFAREIYDMIFTEKKRLIKKLLNA